MITEDIISVKERIAKLIAMAKDSSSPHEAAIAARRARSLMDKYQLSEADIDNNYTESFSDERASGDYKAVPRWVDWLSVAVATLNDCTSARARKRSEDRNVRDSHYLRFKGYETDVAIATAMFNGFIILIDRLCANYMRERVYLANKSVSNAFKVGCTRELVERIEAIAKERTEICAIDSEPGTGLMVLKKVEAVHAHFGDPGYKTSYSKTIVTGSTEAARRAGQREGAKIQIQQGLEQSRKFLN